MSTIVERLEPSRELLSQAIVESLKSWPEKQSRIFVEVHYRGRPIEEVARAFNLKPAEVFQILRECDHKLHQALKNLQGSAAVELSGASPRPRAYAASGLMH